jgi:hypothetical protein
MPVKHQMRPEHPVVISLTTLPSRISKIRPCLESLLAGDVLPDKILLALPPTSIRENRRYSVPEFLKDRTFCGSIIEIVNADRDWGPGTKLLGSLAVIPQECYLVLADDDVRYRHDFLAKLLTAQRQNHFSSFSFYTYRTEGLTVGQGCDGYSFWYPNLSGIERFAQDHVINTDLFFHDDLWISFYLASKGISVRSLAPLLGAGLIYEIEHQTNSLSHLGGRLAREQLNRRGMKYLLMEGQMPARTKVITRLIAAYDKIISAQLARLNRLLARLRVHALS